MLSMAGIVGKHLRTIQPSLEEGFPEKIFWYLQNLITTEFLSAQGLLLAGHKGTIWGARIKLRLADARQGPYLLNDFQAHVFQQECP